MSKIGILLVFSSLFSTIVTFFSIKALLVAFVSSSSSSSVSIPFSCCVISSKSVFFAKFSTIVTCFSMKI